MKISYVNKRHWGNSMINSRLKSSSSKVLRHRHNRWINLELDRWKGDGPITNMRRLKPTSLLHEDDSDCEADSPRYQTGVQLRKTRRKIEKSLNIRTLNELVQRQIHETKLQFYRGPILTAARVYESSSLKDFRVRVLEDVHNSDLRLLLQSERPNSAHQALMG